MLSLRPAPAALGDRRDLRDISLLGGAALALSLSLGACTTTPPLAEEGSTSDSEGGGDSEGAALYEAPHAEGNSYACASCHSLAEPAADGIRRPGHAIGGSPDRPHYKNSQLVRFEDAVNSCLTEWMAAPAWSDDDPRWESLSTFLRDSDAGGGSDPINYSIVEPPTELGGGDPDAGLATFNQSCAVCHGENAEGTTRAPSIVGYPLEPDYIALRVRKSGNTMSEIYPDLVGGRMPFWAEDRFSDDELRDVIAWIESTQPAGDGDGDGDTAGDGDGDGDSTGDGDGDGDTAGDGDGDGGNPNDCDATHPRVGWTATLNGIFHDVAGTATIVDDCTVRFDMFNYDGTGIDVRIYGGANGDYVNGYPMTEDLLLPGGYNNTTLWATLPSDQSLDSLDGVSVWCVDVAVDFGSGSFSAP